MTRLLGWLKAVAALGRPVDDAVPASEVLLSVERRGKNWYLVALLDGHQFFTKVRRGKLP